MGRKHRTERTRRDSTPERVRTQISWPKLATLATLIGIATGMVTLRDAIFPRASSPGAPAIVGTDASSSYSGEIGDVCDALNVAHERSRAARVALKRKLRSARTTGRQRDLLMNNAQQIITGSSAAFVKFDAARPPADSAGLHRKTAATWKQMLESLQEYRRHLADQHTWRDLNALLRRFNHRSSPQLDRNAVTVRVGLGRLARGRCDLEPATPVGVFYIPDRDPKAAPTPSSEPPAPLPDDPQPPPAPVPEVPEPRYTPLQPVPDDPQPPPVPEDPQPEVG